MSTLPCPDILTVHSFGRSSLVKIAHLGRDPRCPKGKAPEQGGARKALDAKVLITLKVSNLDQTATKKRMILHVRPPERLPHPPTPPAARLKEPKSKACTRPRVRRLLGVYFFVASENRPSTVMIAAQSTGGAAGAKRQLTRHSRQCLRQTTFGNCRRTYGSSIRRDSSAKTNARIAGVALTGLHGDKAVAAMGKTLEREGGKRVLRKQERGRAHKSDEPLFHTIPHMYSGY
jgi:hypothetical protein